MQLITWEACGTVFVLAAGVCALADVSTGDTSTSSGSFPLVHCKKNYFDKTAITIYVGSNLRSSLSSGISVINYVNSLQGPVG